MPTKKQTQTPMEKLAKKANDLLKSKQVIPITKADFNKAIKKAAKPKANGSK